MAKPTISMPDAMLDAIDRQPGINRSGWIRDAIDMRFFVEASSEDHEELPEDWWQDAVEMYLSEHDSAASIEA